MNKYQEAKDYYFKVYDENELGMLARHYIDILQEAVDKANKYDEKEKPKKPIIKRVKDEFNGEFYDYPFCPICDSCVVHIHSYCDKCGQRLDWSDEVCQQK